MTDEELSTLRHWAVELSPAEASLARHPRSGSLVLRSSASDVLGDTAAGVEKLRFSSRSSSGEIS